MSRGPERPDGETGHPECQGGAGDGNYPDASVERRRRDPGEEDGEEREERALGAALTGPGHAPSLLVVRALLALVFG